MLQFGGGRSALYRYLCFSPVGAIFRVKTLRWGTHNVDNCFSVFGVSTFGKLSLGAEQLLEEIISCYSTDVSCVEEV